MDAEKFDKVVLDLLYDELDELTRASAIRHMEQSARARALYSELRATREVGSLPLVDPPSDLTARILAAEEGVRAGRPLRQRFGAVVSILAGYTMRPQLAMAALLMLMLGSSLLLLRVKPVEPSNVLVTERGVPESDRESFAVAPAPKPGEGDPLGPRRARPAPAEAPAAQAPAPTPPPASARRERLSAGPSEKSAGAGRAAATSEATRADDGLAFGDLADKAKEDAPRAATDACAQYEATAAAASTQSASLEATWNAGECYAHSGRIERARSLYRSLLSEPNYAEKARAAIAALPTAVAAKKSAASTRAAAAPAADEARPAPAKPADADHPASEPPAAAPPP